MLVLSDGVRSKKVRENSKFYNNHLSMLSFIKSEFITYCTENQVLKFNSQVPFILKSGRESPWFFNAGNLMQHGE